jgi:DNA-binding transcriptional regulator YdaS (Cro superfamily)
MWNGPSRVRTALAKAVRKAGSQKDFAEKHGLSPSYINDVLRNRREISGRLAKALGYERRIMYWSDFRSNRV